MQGHRRSRFRIHHFVVDTVNGMEGFEDTRAPMGDGKGLEKMHYGVAGYAVGCELQIANQSRSVCIGGIFHQEIDGGLYGF